MYSTNFNNKCSKYEKVQHPRKPDKNIWLTDAIKKTEYFIGMLCHSLGAAIIYISLQHFIALALDLPLCLQARGTRDCNKGSKFMKGAKVLLENLQVVL